MQNANNRSHENEPTKVGLHIAKDHVLVSILIIHVTLQVSQVCAYELGVPLSLIRVKKGSSIGNANSITTGGSITSELNALVRAGRPVL